MRALIPVLLLATFALAGCSDDSPDGDADETTDSGTPTGQMPGGSMPMAPMTHESAMRNNQFVPADFTVHVGDTIHWVTEDVQAHNVVSNSATDPFRSPDVSTVPVPPGRSAEYSHTFAKEGTVDYLCEYHSGMVGTVTVVPANQTIA